MTVATSTVPAFINALLTALAAPVAAVDGALHDGPPISDEHTDYVAVGYAENGPAVEASQQAETLRNGRTEEYTVVCQVVAASGDNDMKATRVRAFALFAVVETVLRADWTVTGATTFAEVASYSLTQIQSTDGAVAVIDFTLAVRIQPL